ncbi:MAG TPA: hypothetical protein VK976_11330 [Verrucomicrobiae bacterium]|jgi:hypothetical protein|nr:hypothetical protein [Verrucomicrobiae bacterium]
MDLTKTAMLKSSAAVLFGLLCLTDVVVPAQNPSTNDELAAIEQAESANQTKLSRYTWQETQVISVNGEVVDYRLYSASIGANGQYHRKLVTESTGQEATFRPNKKKQLSQYGPYAQELWELANQYTSLNNEQLTQAHNRGDIELLRQGDLSKLAINNYAKPGDSLAMTINQRTHQPLRVQAKSYLADLQDAVVIQAEFAELPDGSSHVANAEIDSTSKHLTVKLTNWSYQ